MGPKNECHTATWNQTIIATGWASAHGESGKTKAQPKATQSDAGVARATECRGGEPMTEQKNAPSSLSERQENSDKLMG